MATPQELRERAAASRKTADTYDNIGYPGHAAAAERQAEILDKAAAKVERGQKVWDYETRQYSG